MRIVKGLMMKKKIGMTPVKKILIFLLIGYLLLTVLPRPQSVEGENKLRKESFGSPILIAHGGGNHEFPDNTLEAFYNAYSIDDRVMMETDVNLTKDGVVILSHDTTLDRKTNLTNALIIETNYADLVSDEVDFAYQNEVVPNSNGFNVSGVFNTYKNFLDETVTPLDVTYPDGVVARHETKFLVTTLEDLITSFPDNPINVEIKQTGDTGLLALAAVVTLLEDLDDVYNTYDRVVLVTFHSEVYEQMKVYQKDGHPELMIAPETNGVIKFYALFLTGLTVFFNEPIAVLQIPTEQYGLSLSTKALIRIAHRHNIAVHYWTIDDADEMRRLLDNGADGIMTNRPSVLKVVLNSYID